MFLFCFTHHISNDHVHSLKPGLNFLMLCSLKSLNAKKQRRQPLERGAQVYYRLVKNISGLVKKRTDNHMDTRWVGEKKGQNRFTRRGFHYPVTYKEQTECPMMREGPQFYYTADGCCISQLYYSVLVTYIAMFCFFKKKKEKRTVTCK